MKSKKNLIEQLNTLPHFNKSAVYQLGESYGLTKATIETYISRYLKSKEIISLKRGLYVSVDFLGKNKGDISYSFYLANILRTPSYITSWTALQYYDLTTELIHTITSATTKKTETYETKAGSFAYQSIQKGLFSEFFLVKGSSSASIGKPSSSTGRFDFYIASPAKALFDLLYFKTHQFRGVRLEDIDDLVSSLRIDIDEMEDKERKKFYKLIKEYIKNK